MLLCKVIKQSGETGLRKPGSLYPEQDTKALKLEAVGLVEIQPAIETKELKTAKPKPRGNKTVIETKSKK